MSTLADDLREEQRRLNMRYDLAMARRRGPLSLDEARVLGHRYALPSSPEPSPQAPSPDTAVSLDHVAARPDPVPVKADAGSGTGALSRLAAFFDSSPLPTSPLDGPLAISTETSDTERTS